MEVIGDLDKGVEWWGQMSDWKEFSQNGVHEDAGRKIIHMIFLTNFFKCIV